MKLTLAASLLCLFGVIAPGNAGASADSPDPIATKPPAIDLREELTDQNPSAFARRLGEVLGLEIRLPARGFRKLSVPPGEWTATQMLNHVAQRTGGLSWKHVFELRAPVRGVLAKPSPASKLPVTGNLTLRADGVTFPRVVDSVQEAGACLIRLPDGAPPGRFRIAWKEAPLEQVLTPLAQAGGLRIARVIVFQTADEAQQEAERDQQAQLSREALQQGEIANRLQELYGFDPYGEDFPWDTIDRPEVSASLGRELDLSGALVDSLMERIRLEGLTRLAE